MQKFPIDSYSNENLISFFSAPGEPLSAVRFTPNFACGRTLVSDMSSPLSGVSGLRRAEKGGNEIFVIIEVNEEFSHFGGFWAISQQRVNGSTPNFLCVGTMSADVPLPPLGSIGPWGQVEEKKNSKMGGLTGLIRAVDSYHFYFSQRFQVWFNMWGRDLRSFWCRIVNIGQGDSTGCAKKFEKDRIVHHFETLRPHTSETIKIEAHKQRKKKKVYPSPIQLSHVPSVVRATPHRSRGSTGWAKNWLT